MLARSLSLLLVLVLAAADFSPALAQAFLSPPKAEAIEVENQESPRFMMRRFLEILSSNDVDKAFSFVEFPKGLSLEERRLMIEDLIEVLNKRGNIDIALISNNPMGTSSDSLDPNIEKIGTVRDGGTTVPITLRYSVDKTKKGSWRFESGFMEKVPEIAASLDSNGIERRLPLQFKQEYFGVKLWQWLGLIVVVAASVLSAWLLAWLLVFILKRIVKRVEIVVPNDIFTSFITPLRLFTGLTVFGVLVLFLDTDLEFRQKLAFFETIAVTISFCLFALRITAAAIEFTRLAYDRQGKHNATAMLGPLRKGIAMLIVILGAINLMRNLGFDVTAVIASLGIVGVAIALAGQKTVENLFGGVSIIMDQPVRVGDFGRFGSVMGTVEDIGLRSTKVRTLDRTLVSIPNAEFSHMTLENFEKRDKFRWNASLNIRLDTSSDQMRLVLMQIKELFLSHPMVYKDPARVRFTGFAPSGLTIEVFAYIRASDSNESLAVIEDLNLRALDIIRDAGTDLAYPGQTQPFERLAGVDREKLDGALQKIADIKAGSGFPLPHYPASWAESRIDTLEFPDVSDIKD